MPLLNELWEESLQNDQFALISVAVDDSDTVDRLRGVIDENGIKYPVLHAMNGNQGDGFDWDVEYLPFDYLIDPQGVILNTVWVRPDFPEFVSWLDLQGTALPRYALSVKGQRNADMSFTACFSVSSSSHQPLDLEFGALWHFPEPDSRYEDMLWDGEDHLVRRIEFNEFGDYSFVVDFPAQDGPDDFYCWAGLEVPGMQHVYDGDGFAINSDCRIYFDEEGNLLDW